MIYLTEQQAEVGIAAGMWTKEQLGAAKKNPDGHIKHQYFLSKQIENVTSSDRTGNDIFPNS